MVESYLIHAGHVPQHIVAATCNSPADLELPLLRDRWRQVINSTCNRKVVVTRLQRGVQSGDNAMFLQRLHNLQSTQGTTPVRQDD